jgi:hypothetical protein
LLTPVSIELGALGLWRIFTRANLRNPRLIPGGTLILAHFF